MRHVSDPLANVLISMHKNADDKGKAQIEVMLSDLRRKLTDEINEDKIHVEYQKR